MYRTWNQELRELFGRKVYKLSLSGNMTCPNRDGTLDTRGCIFCNGSGDFTTGGSLARQMEQARALVARKAGNGPYIAYFQSYTNTYAPAGVLRSLYTQALSFPDVVGLSIATRPDCLPPEVLELLASLASSCPVWVELGLQTVHEATARYIRRGYDLEVYDRAVADLTRAGCRVVTHMIVGLPGETEAMMRQTARHIAEAGSGGIKIHLLHVLQNTDLEKDYRAGLFRTLTLEEYTKIVAEILRRLPPEMVIHRITGDGAKRHLVAPLWSADKRHVLNYMNGYFRTHDVRQGDAYGQAAQNIL